jgi:hypothetical protein
VVFVFETMQLDSKILEFRHMSNFSLESNRERMVAGLGQLRGCQGGQRGIKVGINRVSTMPYIIKLTNSIIK